MLALQSFMITVFILDWMYMLRGLPKENQMDSCHLNSDNSDKVAKGRIIV